MKMRSTSFSLAVFLLSVDSASSNVGGESDSILPIHSMRVVASGLGRDISRSMSLQFYRKSFETNKAAASQGKASLTRNKQPIRINFINAVLSNRTYRICSTKEYSRPYSARKHRVLHNQYLISKIRFELVSASTPIAPQYSLNLSFLPISRRLALTVARSEGLMFPSSTSSPLALRA